MDRLEIKYIKNRYLILLEISTSQHHEEQYVWINFKAHTIRSAQVRWMRRSIILFLLCSLNLSLRRWTRE